jgi:hypothetical protein
MINFSKKTALLLASGVFAWWLGGSQYPDQPLSRTIETLLLVQQTAILIEVFDKDKQKEEKSLKG